MATGTLPYIVPLGHVNGVFEGTFDTVFNDAAGVFTDLTADADDTTTTGGALTGTSGHIVYFGCTNETFDKITIDVQTAPVGGTRAWTYWNGSTWASLSVTWTTGNANLTADSAGNWTPPTDWATTAINSTTRYWIRGTVGTGYSTAGTIAMARVGRLIKLCDALTLYHAATTSRVWRTALVRAMFNTDGVACTGYLPTLYVQLGAATIQRTTNVAVTNSGEHYTQELLADMSSYFDSNFGTGSTQTLTVWVSFGHATSSTCTATGVGGAGWSNLSGMLLADVEYNTSNSTITKCALIPIESSTARLTNSLAELGTNQVPVLTGGGSPFLPESSITVRDSGFWLMANNMANSTTDFQLGVALDAEGETLFGTQDNAGNTSRYFETVWRKTFTTTTTHAFKARSTVNTTVWLCGLLIVIYDCDPTSSTQLVSRLEPYTSGEHTDLVADASAATDRVVATQTIYTPEQSVSLKQSGVLLYWGCYTNAATNLTILHGGQSARTYTAVNAASTLSAGDAPILQRIDSGGAQGAGVTLVSGGSTTLTTKYYVSAISLTTPFGFVVLNYHANKPSGGEHLMTRTRLINMLAPTAAAVQGTLASGWSVSIPHTNYWISSAAWWIGNMDASSFGCSISVLRASSSTGYLYTSYCRPSNAEMGLHQALVDCLPNWKQHPTDPRNNREALTASHTVAYERTLNSTAGVMRAVALVNYHGMTWTKAMDVSAYGGTGSGLTVDVYHRDTKEWLYTATTGTAGDLQLTGYDNADVYFAVCREDGTHVGRSNDFSFDNT